MGKGEFAGLDLLRRRKRFRRLSKRWKRKALKLWKKYDALEGAPQGKGIVLEKRVLEQKQPHSGLIKCVKVQLIKNGKVVTAHVPRDKAINYIDEHDEVVVERIGGVMGRAKGDLPGVRWQVIKVNDQALAALLSGKVEKARK